MTDARTCPRCGVELTTLDPNNPRYTSAHWEGQHIHSDARCADRLAARLKVAREALDVIATCPPEAVHLMPLAAQSALAALDAAAKRGEKP